MRTPRIKTTLHIDGVGGMYDQYQWIESDVKMKIPNNVVRAMRANGCKHLHELLLAGTANALKLPECSVKTVRWCVDNAPIVVCKLTPAQYINAVEYLTRGDSAIDSFITERLHIETVIGKRLVTDQWCPIHIASVCASVTVVEPATGIFKTYNIKEV
jgi:hypothetical protein